MIQSEEVLAARRLRFGSVDNTVSEDVLAARRMKFGNGTVNEDVRMKRQQKFGIVERTNISFHTSQNRKRNGSFVNYPKRRRY